MASNFQQQKVGLKIDIFKSSAVFLLPSIRDSFGMGYIEAMSFGVPCIGYNIEAIPEVASGVLVEHDSNREQNIVSAINEILETEIKYEYYCQKALNEAEKFSKSNTMEKWYAHFSSC